MNQQLLNSVLFRLSASLLIILPATCFSAIQCNIAPPLKEDVMTISANITVGADTPVGTVVYKARYVSSGYESINCNASNYSVENWVDYFNIPSADAGIYLPGYGKVYNTNLPGLGVAITGTGNGQSFPRMEATWRENQSIKHAYTLWIIKTGTVSPGTLNGSSLPSVRSYAAEKSGYSGLPFDVLHLRFAGAIHVISETCKTSDINVNLGKYETARYFKGKGSTTPWVDSSIILADCPAFKGYYNRVNSSVNITGSGVTPAGNPDPNSLSVSIKPLQSIVDTMNGIMTVSSDAGSNAALGIGIQIGWGAASDSPVPFNLCQPKTFSPPADGRTSFKIPLAARYIQTDDHVSPGKADGRVIFTINYY